MLLNPVLWLAAVAAPLPQACLDAPQACVPLAAQAEANGQRALARALQKQACKPLHPQHCAPLAGSLGTGRRVLARAESLCDTGYGGVCNRLGTFYTSEASPRNTELGVTLQERACTLGEEHGCHAAGYWYASGYVGVARNASLATGYFGQGCDLGHADSCRDYATRLADGRGVKADPARAAALLAERCLDGDGASCETYGDWMAVGRGVKADHDRAQDAYGTACRSGSKTACAHLDAVRNAPLGACAQGDRAACNTAANETTDPILRKQLRFAAQQPADKPRKTDVVAPLSWSPDADEMQRCMSTQLAVFADAALEGRGTLQRGGYEAANRLNKAFQDGGYQTILQDVVVQNRARPKDRDLSDKYGARNIIAILQGKGALAGEGLVVGAHFDHLGIDGDGVAFIGADDNASGTAALVCLATVMRQHLSHVPTHRTLVFAGFDAEEVGLLGSQTYVESPAYPLERTVGMVNLDMVGRLDEVLYASAHPTELMPLVEAAAGSVGLEVRPKSNPGSSDHLWFADRSIPTVHITTGDQGDYHQPTDNLSRIDVADTATVASTAGALLYRLAIVADPPPPLTSNCHPDLTSRMGYTLTVGLFTGPRTVNCVADVSAAAAIGLLPGDQLAWPVQNWPTEPVHLRVTRGDECLLLNIESSTPVACPG
jgi:hypothetical protein